MTNDREFKVNVVYGHIDCRAWLEFDGEKYIGMSSKATYDKDGKITDWKTEPTGLVARVK